MQKVKQLHVVTPQGAAGDLIHESRYVFNYKSTQREAEISLTMPLRAESYANTALPPIFSMNRPEGWLQQRLIERMSKHMQIDDMRLLSVTGGNQVGRLSYVDPSENRTMSPPTIGLEYLLGHENSREVFEFLVDQYLESGISGVQPKVLVPDADIMQVDKATIVAADLIVKSSGDEYPHLAVNEFLCMDAARRAGIMVPEFWLSADRGLFVMRRFDLQAGARLGFEDMAVLMGKQSDAGGRYKYEGSYENVVKAISIYCRDGESVASTRQFFDYLTLSVMVRNGDAHLKNFGLLYEHPHSNSSPTIAPLYDIVTTAVYDHTNQRTGQTVSDRTLALKLKRSNAYPSRETLLQFGSGECHVLQPAQSIDRIATAMTETLLAYPDLASKDFMMRLTREWGAGRISLEPARIFVPAAVTPPPTPF